MEAIMANNYDDLVRNAYRYMRHNNKFDGGGTNDSKCCEMQYATMLRHFISYLFTPSKSKTGK